MGGGEEVKMHKREGESRQADRQLQLERDRGARRKHFLSHKQNSLHTLKWISQ